MFIVKTYNSIVYKDFSWTEEKYCANFGYYKKT